MTCGGKAAALPAQTANGRVTAKQGGRRVVLGQLFGGGSRVTVDQVDGQPGVYHGRHIVRDRGQRIPFTYRVTVEDPEHFEATMSGKFRGDDGTACRLTTVWQSTWIGE